MPSWLAQTSPDPTGGVLLQYGAIGAILVLAVWAVYYLYRRQERQHDQERDSWRLMFQEERQRGDRLEERLLGLHGEIGNKFAGALAESTASMREWSETMKNRGDR